MKRILYIFGSIPKRTPAFLSLLIMLSFCSSAQGIHITAGAQWIVSGAPSLVLNNASLINNGSFDAGNSTVLFTGDAPTSGSFIGGDIPVSFYNVVVSKSSNDLLLNNSTAIAGSIIMNKGNLQLNNYTLDLGSTGSIIGERDSSCITGAGGGLIKIKMLLNAPHDINPGNIGIELSSQANLGLTVITRGHEPQFNSNGQSGIQRYFDITPEINTDLPANLRFFYLDSELAGKNKRDLVLFSGQQGINDWTSSGKDGSDGTAGWVVKNNISKLHRFTLAIPPTGNSIQRRTALQIFPNPSSGAFRTTLVSEAAKVRTLNLYDQRGHLMESKIIYCQAGVNIIEWNASTLAGGGYYLSTEGLPAAAIEIIR